ncbi:MULTISPECIES: sensor histidine kinase [unclassified Agrococcus]|uniref:sensor histidine kinase n=1 Tax=unclassified Agrococcus TaxID=2615065 RepID=UPI003608E4A1
MTLTRLTALAARWWTVPLAVVLLLSISLTYVQSIPSAAIVALALGIARRWPAAALLAAATAFVLCQVAIDPWSGSWVAIALVAALTVAVATYDLDPMAWRLAAGIGVVAVASLGGFVGAAYRSMALGPSVALGEVLGVALLGTLAWAIPFGIRAFQAALHAERERSTVQARTVVVESELRDERLRADLTHDFHDVMAHSLAVLAAQAEGLRLTHRDHPERIEPVLTTISDTARLALVEVRQLLERVDDDARRPQPTIEDIPALVDQTRTAGPAVTFHDAGRHGALPRIGGIAAYRIVQEALTNALRHGGSDADVVVTLSWTGPGLSLAISSPIRDRTSLGPMGRGIAGMHERARQAGGWVDVDADGDRFVVTAYLPYEPEPSGSTILGEDQLPTVPVHVVPQATAAATDPWAPRGATADPAPAPPTVPTPAATWSEANAREVRLGMPGDGRA